ncbi:MAG: hypothetical protein A3F72_04150 [Bacteroidetes bacterium RIFCSPLOWO2_12_FULL_35_15]|nr:MAG: hypothetical protein A3F72_04150 [Bacteroidetes bacterium RIFCSPLOWO2_12_FULL_35_15]
MIQIKNILSSKSIIVDQNGQLSINQIVDDIACQSVPTRLTELCFILFFERDMKDSNTLNGVEITLYLNETIISKNILNIDFKGRKHNRTIAELSNLSITALGELKIVARLENVKIGEHKIDILKADINS